MTTQAAEPVRYGFGRIRCTHVGDTDTYELPGPRFVQVVALLGAFLAGVAFLAFIGREIVTTAANQTPPMWAAVWFCLGVEVLVAAFLAALLLWPLWRCHARPQRIVVSAGWIRVERLGLLRRGEVTFATARLRGVGDNGPGDVLLPGGGLGLPFSYRVPLFYAEEAVLVGETLGPDEAAWLEERLQAYAGPDRWAGA